MAARRETSINLPALTLLKYGQNTSKVRIRPRYLILLVLIIAGIVAGLDIIYYNSQ